MRLLLVIAISLIANSYTLSPPLAGVGIAPDYALEDNQLEAIELEIDGDYINIDVYPDQGQNKDLKEDDFAFNIIADDKSRSVDIKFQDIPSVHIPEGIESQTFTYTADSGITVTIEGLHHYESHPPKVLNSHITKSTLHPNLNYGGKGHYTLPVELDPTI